jgi:hypothetical protein
MSDLRNRPEPKKIKMPPLVDRSQEYDIMEGYEPINHNTNETNNQNNPQSVQQVESLKTD